MFEKNQLNKTTLGLSGLHCAACVRRVENILQRQSGVEKASVNLATQKALVIYRDGFKNIEQWSEALSKAGFELKGYDDNIPITDKVKEVKKIKNQFLLALILGLIGLPLSMPELVSFLNPMFAVFGAWFIASLVIVFPGRQFFVLAFKALKQKTADMNTLVALGTGTAYIYSSVMLFKAIFSNIPMTHNEHYFFDSFFMIMALILLGKWLEARARGQASAAIGHLLELSPKTARILTKDGEKDIPLELIVPGNHLLIRPNETIAVDGKILQGKSTVDEAILTGESIPVDKAEDDIVHGGSKNLHGLLVVEATSTGADSALGRIIKMVEEAQGSKPPIQELADRVAAIFTPIVLCIALITAILWLSNGAEFSEAITRMVAVLVVACPCAMGLATPTAVMVASGRGADLGILFKNALSLETASKINAVCLDKTGTLTIGKPTLIRYDSIERDNDLDILKWAAILERGSDHPLAKAVLEKAATVGYNPFYSELPANFKLLTGVGVSGTIDGHEFILAKEATLKDYDFTQIENKISSSVHTTAFLARDKKVIGCLSWSDPLKNEALEAIKQMKELNLKLIMLTGDSKAVANQVAGKLSIDYLAELSPEDKLEEIKNLKTKNNVVAMVGDGLNDAPALAISDLGIAMGQGAEAALESASIALPGNNLEKIPTAIKLGKATVTIIYQNLFWAFFYNILTIPLAAGLFSSYGLVLSPAVCAGAMAISSVSVISNSLRLKKFK